MIGIKFINTDELNNVEIIQSNHKKVWRTPELDVLDGRKTYGGTIDFNDEDGLYNDFVS